MNKVKLDEAFLRNELKKIRNIFKRAIADKIDEVTPEDILWMVDVIEYGRKPINLNETEPFHIDEIPRLPIIPRFVYDKDKNLKQIILDLGIIKVDLKELLKDDND